MLRTVRQILKCRVVSDKGGFWRVRDLYVDEKEWVAAFLVVRSGIWPFSRKIRLMPCEAIDEIDTASGLIATSSDPADPEEAVAPDLAQPVSALFRNRLVKALGWILNGMPVPRPAARKTPLGGRPLRSVREMFGYRVFWDRIAMGRLSDFFMDDSDWNVGALLLESRSKPWSKPKIYTAPTRLVNQIAWGGRRIQLARVWPDPGTE